MTATVVPLDGDPHHAVQSLLPWYATGRLDAAETAQVETHLAGCAQCRAELAWDRKLLALPPAPDAAANDVAQGLAWLRRRIDEAVRAGRPQARRRAGPAPWLRWVLGLQFATIVALAVGLAVPGRTNDAYHALGRPGPAAAGNAVVRFRPEATEQDVRHALRAAGARVVDGPTVTDAYVLSLPAATQAAAMAGLRANRWVVLAESLEPEPRP